MFEKKLLQSECLTPAGGAIYQCSDCGWSMLKPKFPKAYYCTTVFWDKIYLDGCRILGKVMEKVKLP